jgi:hypothetical protein
MLLKTCIYRIVTLIRGLDNRQYVWSIQLKEEVEGKSLVSELCCTVWFQLSIATACFQLSTITVCLQLCRFLNLLVLFITFLNVEEELAFS